MLKNLSILLENAKHVQKLLNEIENSFCHSLALFFYGKYIYIYYIVRVYTNVFPFQYISLKYTRTENSGSQLSI